MSFYGNRVDEVILMIENDDYGLLFRSEDEGHFKDMDETGRNGIGGILGLIDTIKRELLQLYK